MNGKFKSYLGVGVALFFSVIMIISAIFILRQPKYIETIGTIINVSNTCTADVCTSTVKFTAKGQEYTKDFKIGSPKLNTTIPIFFTEDSPPQFSTSSGPSKRFGYILLIIATLMIILSIGIAYYINTIGATTPTVPDIANSNPLNRNLGETPAPPPDNK